MVKTTSETPDARLMAATAERIDGEVRGVDDRADPFVAAVRATRMPMIITNPRLPDNPVVFANDAFCRLSGYARHEILGRNCRFLQGPKTDPNTVKRIRAAVERVEAIEIDILNHRKSGETFWNRLLMAPVFDVSGLLTYFFASQVDVTVERERLQGLESDNNALMAELTNQLQMQKERERELAFAMRAGRFGTWSIDCVTREMNASDTCKALFGREIDQPFTYADRLQAILPEDRAAAEAAMDRSFSDDSDYDVTYRILRPDGAVRWIASRGQAFFGGDRRPLRMAGVSFDITGQRREERMRAALVELGDVFRHLEDPAEISFAAAELIGRTLEVSRAGYGVVDPNAETITIERDWNAPGITTIAGTLRFRDFGSYIDDVKRGETVVVVDARLDPRTRDTAGALEGISARAFVNMPITEQGGVVAMLYLNHEHAREWPQDEQAFIREVAERTRSATERRRAERALADLAASLETQVRQRTKALMEAEEALRQSQKMEAVGQLTGGLAHDFNNLLTGISGSLEMLEHRLSERRYDAVDRYIAAAQGAAKRAAALTHRLLAFSRRQTLDPKTTDVNRLIADMEELVRRTVGPGVQIEVVQAGGLWPTLIDPNQLENALLNLCINARDAMPQGGRITIETANKWLDDRAAASRDLAPGQYVSLCVTDTGTGMSADVIARAFDPFFTTKPLGEGTGLGLSMIYGFARQSGGQVRIYSELGQGTTMCLYLPRDHSASGPGDGDDAAEAAPEPGSGEMVLVVDDEATIRMLITEVLEGFGYGSIEATDGAGALRVLESGARIDLLITDVGLPGGMNGRQVADAARVQRPDLKVLFITGYAENAVIGNGHLAPGMQVLTKPFAMTDLARRIQALLAAR
jgi:PAS domain S-box-containing protein